MQYWEAVESEAYDVAWLEACDSFCLDGVSIFSPNHLNQVNAYPLERALQAETVTNARIKRYRSKDVIQVSNDNIFCNGEWESSDGKKKRKYDVPPPGQAADPKRSLEESKRRAKSKVRDIALCNAFTHMFTWTLDGDLIDRYDAAEVYKKVRTFLTNAVSRKGFSYV